MTVRKYIEAGVHSIDTMTYISLSLAKTYIIQSVLRNHAILKCFPNSLVFFKGRVQLSLDFKL